MGTGNLDTTATGNTVLAQDVNQTVSALQGDVVGRNTSGVPTAGQRLGTPLYPWGSGHFTSLSIGGQNIDPSALTSKANRVVSGAVRTTSNQVDFLRASGSGLTATIQATVTTLSLDINATSLDIIADIGITGLTAAPSANNTALVNDTALTGQQSSKYQGERETVLTIDNIGSEWTSAIGKVIAVKVGASTEILIGTLESATELINCFRGFFFDSSGDPLVRTTVSNNDTLTLLSIGWVFANSDGIGYDVTYNAPYYGPEPASTTTGDYWLDDENQVWKEYDGADWVQSNRTLIGYVVSDTTDCIGSRSLDPYIIYSSLNNISYKYDSVTQVVSKDVRGEVSIYGTEFDFDSRRLVFDIATDLESPLTEQASTTYYGYIDRYGSRFISDERPFERLDLQGFYHPYNSWRYQFDIFNDSSSDFVDYLLDYESSPLKYALIAASPYIFGSINDHIEYDNIIGAEGIGISTGTGQQLGEVTFKKGHKYTIILTAHLLLGATFAAIVELYSLTDSVPISSLENSGGPDLWLVASSATHSLSTSSFILDLRNSKEDHQIVARITAGTITSIETTNTMEVKEIK